MGACRRDLLRVAPEYQTDARTATLAVLEHQRAAMVFHDLLDDRESQPGTLAARRHIRLGQAVAAFLRQALAIVLDDDADGGALVLQLERNFSRRQRLTGPRLAPLDRLGGILQ